MNIMGVVIAGALGTLFRFMIYGMVTPMGVTVIPLGTFIANILGCFVIGVLVGWDESSLNQNLKIALMIGFCGALTTFSSLILEISNMAKQGEGAKIAIYIIASLVAGFLIFRFGLTCAEKMSG